MSAAAAPAEGKKSGKKTILIAALVGLAVAGGGAGGAFWYFGQQAKAHAPEAEAKKAPPKKAVFANLEPFTVNLQDSRGERYAQIGITLEVDDPAVEIELKDRLPTVRNNILLLISSKKIDDLLSPEGKQQLAGQIRDSAGQALATAHAKAPAENPIRGVLFSQFLVQ